MEEQINVGTLKPRFKRIVPILILLALAISGFVFIAWRGNAVDPATYIPKEASMVLTLDFTRSSDKDAAMKFVLDRCKEAGIKDPEKDAFAEISRKFGLDFEKDLLPHINRTGAIAVLTQLDGIMPEIVAAVGMKSQKHADTVMVTIGNKLNKENVEFNKAEYKGVAYYSIPDKNEYAGMQVTSYIASVNSSVIYANTKTALEKIVDTAKGAPNLLSDKNYTSLCKKSDGTFATAYYSGPNFYKLVGPALQMAMVMAPHLDPDDVQKTIESNIATVCTADASANGFKLTVRGLTENKSYATKLSSIDNLAAGAPKDAAFVVSLGNCKGLFNQSKKSVPFFQALPLAKYAVGLDIDTSGLGKVTSVQGYYIPKRMKNPDAIPGDIDVVLGADKPQELADIIKKMHTALARTGGPVLKPTTFNGQTAFVAPISPEGEVLADALIGGKALLHLSGSLDSVADAVAAVKAGGPGIASSDKFQLVKKLLPSEAEGLVYGDINAIIRACGNHMPARDRKAAEAITRKIGVFGVTAKATATSYEVQAVVPFIK